MKSRLILVECPMCDEQGEPYKVRMSRATYGRGRPICPIHECAMSTQEDIKAERALHARMAKNRPAHIIDFLASRGGLKPDPGGELLNIALKHYSRPHLWRVKMPDYKAPMPFIRQSNALTLSYALEAAIEAGYLSEEAWETDLLDAIEETMDGRPFYKPEDFAFTQIAA